MKKIPNKNDLLYLIQEINRIPLKNDVYIKLYDLIDAYDFLYNRNTCEFCTEPCLNEWCVTNVSNNCNNKSN